ncbi:alkaline phosphatase, tissue-nonspecific isozyme-like isoform X2 [Gigantopelta aegis]|uniref:alkaline phosphatase, tissue-nonspecific isozyme-like isoform X2 n=1 Tax=Gigantopelta aegis TaxID=1735272 RepID=UPI001B887DC7|nr:alkaline phosphatase, tissue-nonspecific isozyme-like isoform X2 [Gigantopelta aegis]
MKSVSLFVCLLCLSSLSAEEHFDQTHPEFWNDMMREELRRATILSPIVKRADNVILFIGDGMGITTTTAARWLKGQRNNKTGEEGFLTFERFPYVAMSKTYSVDSQTTDSAATATALLSGVKNNYGCVGVDGRVQYDDCETSHGKHVDSVLHWALAEGKSVGIVTTTRVTHATPAAAYAHSASRNWENDFDIQNVYGNCTDIARQLIEDNPNIQVILGGGRSKFMTDNQTDPETGRVSSRARKDGRDLIQAWLDEKEARGVSHHYVWNASAFDDVDTQTTDYLLGLFSDTHMKYELERKDGPTPTEAGEPSIAEMTLKAIEILRRNKNGYFLLVEGGRIDHGHHLNWANLALSDTVALDDAVTVAATETSQEDTLIVVSADHSHVFNIAGYPQRGNPVLGAAGTGSDMLPYTSLVYGNGPGYGRRNITNDELAESLESSLEVLAGDPFS